MIYTRYDKVTFLLRTLATIGVIIFSIFLMQDASGADGYKIVEVQEDRVIVSCGVAKAAISLETTEGLEPEMRVPAYPELVSIARTTYYITIAIIAIMLLWNIGIFLKVGKRIKRSRCKQKGFLQYGSITSYRHIVGNLYTPVVDERFHPEITMTKGDTKKYPIGTKCVIYHLGVKDAWVDITKEKTL